MRGFNSQHRFLGGQLLNLILDCFDGCRDSIFVGVQRHGEDEVLIGKFHDAFICRKNDRNVTFTPIDKRYYECQSLQMAKKRISNLTALLFALAAISSLQMFGVFEVSEPGQMFLVVLLNFGIAFGLSYLIQQVRKGFHSDD